MLPYLVRSHTHAERHGVVNAVQNPLWVERLSVPPQQRAASRSRNSVRQQLPSMANASGIKQGARDFNAPPYEWGGARSGPLLP